MKRILFIALLGILCACTGQSPTDWYVRPAGNPEECVDVFYIVSTQAINEYSPEGEELYRVSLTQDQREFYDMEMDYMAEAFSDEFNFYSPYYHQFTLDAVYLTPEEYERVKEQVVQEVLDAFRYYMKHYNKGHRYILAGFSQGAIISLDLLKRMTDQEYSRMIADYCIGYRISEEDLANPHIRAAQGADDKGVVISFNSVENTDAIWDVVTEGAAACINPLNWRTDSTPAELRYDGDTAEVMIEQEHQVLLVKGLDMDKYRFAPLDGFYPYGNLHHYDILFYSDEIAQNARLRAYGPQ
ncbi:MAG: DUF3089 domain-containing protein [Bacteroidales bacterium]|nr:DUF3089 domain-containing protein [Bacteroidales bacterium]